MAIRKAEMWDKMQYMFRRYYDRMVHLGVKVRGKIDSEVLYKALDVLVDKIDILRCSFVENPLFPHWRVHEAYDVRDIVNVIHSDNLDADMDNSLCVCIPVESRFQIRINIIETDGEETGFTMLVNHMCSDGGDCKYIMGKITELYADILNGGDGSTVEIKQGRRDSEQVYDHMSPEKAKKAKGLYKNISQSGSDVKFPFTSSTRKEKEQVRLFRISLEKSLFDGINAARKKCNATVNDVLLAAFFRTLYNYLDGKQSDLTIISMMDLRRYCGGESLGVTNLTGFAPCDITVGEESFSVTLDKVVKRMAQNKADEFMGLYSLPLLKLAYNVIPYFASENIICLGYKNPLIGMSNMGILDKERFGFAGCELVDGFMTGAAKYKPYMQLTATTCNDTMTLCIAEMCNNRDGYILSQFLRDCKAELKRFIEEARLSD